MNDLISRSALINKIEAYCIESQDVKFIKDMIKEAPTVEHVRGEWEEIPLHYKCTNCNTEFDDDIAWVTGGFGLPKFCPECGASMTGEDARSKYEIDLEGCDDSTVFEMMLSDSEYQTLLKVSKKANDTSTYTCMPRMYVNKADMRGEKND